MSFRIYCDVKDADGKKCNKDMSPRIGKKDRLLYCECGKVLENQKCITEFAKNNLISLGKVHNADNFKKPYAVKCQGCSYTDSPVVNKEKGTLNCSSCHVELKVSDFFKKMVFEKCSK